MKYDSEPPLVSLLFISDFCAGYNIVDETSWKLNKSYSWIWCKCAPTVCIDFIDDTKLWNKSDWNQRGFIILFYPRDVLKPLKMSPIKKKKNWWRFIQLLIGSAGEVNLCHRLHKELADASATGADTSAAYIKGGQICLPLCWKWADTSANSANTSNESLAWISAY
jgi:hypothetical protein